MNAEVTPTPELISSVAGLLITLVLSYFPKVNTWYAVLTSATKSFINIGLMLLVTAAVFGLACARIIPVSNFVCSQQTLVSFVWLFYWAAQADVVSYIALPQTKAVRAAKLLQK